MDDNKLQVNYPLSSRQPSQSDIEEIILENISDFYPLLGRYIDDDGRTTLLDDSIEVNEIWISPKFDEGSFEFYFESEFYVGCKDMNSINDHDAFVEFDIINGELVIDMTLPAPQNWGGSDIY